MPTAIVASRSGSVFSAPPRGDSMMLADALDRILQRGVSVQGNVTIGLAEVELLYLDLRLLLGSVDTIWPEGRPPVEPIRPTEAPELPPPARAETPADAPAATGPRYPVQPRVEARPPAPRDDRIASTSSTAQGLVRLVLTLVKLLHDVLQRQAVRRMEAGRLTDAQIESVGTALLNQAEEIERLRRLFDLSDTDLSIDLGVPDGAP